MTTVQRVETTVPITTLKEEKTATTNKNQI